MTAVDERPPETAPRSALGLFAAAVAFLLPTLFLPTVSAPFWAPKYALVMVLAGVGLPLLFLRPPSGQTGATWAARSFLAVAALSTALSANPDLALVGLWNQGTGLLLLAAAAGAWAIGLRLTPADRTLLIRALVAAAGINAVVIVGEMSLDLSPFGLERFMGRAPGLTQSPVFVGPLLAATATLLVAAFRRPAWWMILAAVSGLSVAVALSGGRGALILLAVTVIAAQLSRGAKAAGSVVIVIVIAVLVAPLLDRPPPPPISASSQDSEAIVDAPEGRALNLDNRPLSPRLATWWSARKAVLEAPLLGSGPGQFREATIEHRPAQVSADTPDRYFTDAHNFVVEHAVTTGLAGAACLLVWLWLAARQAGGPLGVFALVLGLSHLFQPENIATTPLALLALGAAAGLRTEAAAPIEPAKAALPARVLLAAAATASAVLAVLFLWGSWSLREAELDFDLGRAHQADRFLRPWPQPQTRIGLIHQYAWATGGEESAEPARRGFSAAARREPDNPHRWVALAHVAVSHDRRAIAERAVSTALKLDPRSNRARAVLLRLPQDAARRPFAS